MLKKQVREEIIGERSPKYNSNQMELKTLRNKGAIGAQR